jgi:hypothetical protein
MKRGMAQQAAHAAAVLQGDRMLRKVALAIAVLLAGAPGLAAKEWARSMFATTSHDFGHVARGAKAEFAFELQNLYEEDIHIADVRTSCGCATPSITQPTLKTWEKGAIVATLNTRSFIGQRSSTLTVVIDKPYYAEVYLTISGNIHGDVDFQPGSVAFGDVEMGRSAQQQVMVNYRGRAAWQIRDVRSASEHLEVELSDPIRQLGMTSYRMTVRLKPDTPPGMIQEELTLVTTDQRMPTVQLAVEGRVAPPLSVSPSPLFFGSLQPGQSATKQLVLAGKQPFKVLQVTSDLAGLEFKLATDVVRKVHLVPVTLTAGDVPGDITGVIEIETDLQAGGHTTCQIRGTILGEPAGTPTSAARGNLAPRR